MVGMLLDPLQPSQEPPPGYQWRPCAWPGCPLRFDYVGVFEGRVQPGGWVQRVLSINYMCPNHAAGGHLPTRDGRQVGCECGEWTAAVDAQSLGHALSLWRGHIVAASGPS